MKYVYVVIRQFEDLEPHAELEKIFDTAEKADSYAESKNKEQLNESFKYNFYVETHEVG